MPRPNAAQVRGLNNGTQGRKRPGVAPRPHGCGCLIRAPLVFFRRRWIRLPGPGESLPTIDPLPTSEHEGVSIGGVARDRPATCDRMCAFCCCTPRNCMTYLCNCARCSLGEDDAKAICVTSSVVAQTRALRLRAQTLSHPELKPAADTRSWQKHEATDCRERLHRITIPKNCVSAVFFTRPRAALRSAAGFNPPRSSQLPRAPRCVLPTSRPDETLARSSPSRCVAAQTS